MAGRLCLSALLALAGSAAFASTAGAVNCEIRATKSEHSLRLEAIVKADGPAAGSYRLVVEKRNDAGTSRNAGSGRFALETGGETVLSTTVVDHEKDGDAVASLSLQWKDGEKSCHYP